MKFAGAHLFPTALATAAIVAIPAISIGGCQSAFPTAHSSALLTMSLVKPTAKITGSPLARLPLSFTTAVPFVFDIAAQNPDGSVDTDFTGFVRISAHPGSIAAISGNGAEGRNVLLTNGVASNITVNVLAAYGDTHLWAEDIGYAPADPAAAIPPECSDGLDNNGNGLIDFPADPGCAYANDDSENEGSFTTGISDLLYFSSPRIADVRGVSQGGTATSFPGEQVQIDTGYRDTIPCKNGDAPPCYDFSVIVTRIAADGFYATDISDTRGYSSVYAYNFSAPPNMKVCDRLSSMGGTSSDFFGFTEINYPTWVVDSYLGYDPSKNIGRPCGVPEPYAFIADELPVTPTTTALLLDHAASMVRIETGTITRGRGSSATTYKTAIHVGAHFGENKPTGPNFVPTDMASDCDLDGDGKLDFSAGSDEAKCADNCEADQECTEYSGFLSQSGFRVVIEQTNADGTTSTGAILANASAAATFVAPDFRGKQIKSFTGTLRYFSGGSQFTIEARCPDDIVSDLTKSPLASDVACVGVPNTADGEN